MTYQLLIDAYRLRVHDDHKMVGKVHLDSVYSRRPDAKKGFQRFLRQAESRSGLLPSWWTPEHNEACVAMGQTGGDDRWCRLAAKIEKNDVVGHYDNDLMPMQLRMFGEQVFGTGPGGQDGQMMMQVKMLQENGDLNDAAISHFNLSLS